MCAVISNVRNDRPSTSPARGSVCARVREGGDEEAEEDFRGPEGKGIARRAAEEEGRYGARGEKKRDGEKEKETLTKCS